MSQENVEVARQAIQRWLRGGATLEAIPVDLVAENVEWDFSAYPQIDGPTRGTGAGGLFDNLREYFSAWQSYRAEPGEFIDAGENVAIVLHETAGASGVLVERDLFLVWTFRHGTIVKWRIFETREDALEAAGLRE
jgi:ketosteroid isomerase-like protein